MAIPKKSNIQLKEIRKRIVRLEGSSNELCIIANEDGKVYLSIDGDDEEEYMASFIREDFLDAVVALFPDNVAYQFPEE